MRNELNKSLWHVSNYISVDGIRLFFRTMVYYIKDRHTNLKGSYGRQCVISHSLWNIFLCEIYRPDEEWCMDQNLNKVDFKAFSMHGCMLSNGMYI